MICEENYYFDCSVFCTSRDDNVGHYTCDPVTGGKVCLEGWAGDDCLTSKFKIYLLPHSIWDWRHLLLTPTLAESTSLGHCSN